MKTLQTPRVMQDHVAQHIAALEDEDWAVREDAATALGAYRDPRSVQPLIRALKDSDRSVRAAAVASLRTIGEAAVVPLGYCLQHLDLSVQEHAASILAEIADTRVVEPLISALFSSDWIVRLHAVQALGRIGDARAIETLIMLMQDKVPTVRDEAAKAITAIGEPSVPPLLEALGHKEWPIRLRAVEALALLKPPLAVEPLLACMNHDPDTAVRQDAVRALGEIGDLRAVKPILAVLPQKSLRNQGIEALGKLGDPQAVPVLLDLVNGLVVEDYEGRLPSCADDRYKEDLVPVELAVKALGRIGDVRAIPTLLRSLKITLIRAEAAEALKAFGQAAISPLRTMLNTETDENLKHYLKETLAHLGWRPGQIRL